MERQLTEPLRDLRELLRADVPLARQALRELLVQPILFLQELGGGYRLKDTTRLGGLLDDGLPWAETTRAKSASPRGLERYARGVTVPFGDGEVAA